MTAKSAEAQCLIAALDAELASSAKAAGRDLVWSFDTSRLRTGHRQECADRPLAWELARYVDV
jgi:hypothetical protein